MKTIMERIHEDLANILATTPPEEVIARIEALDPEWKHELLPWQIARPGEAIPWQAVYLLIPQQENAETQAWAQQRLAELRASGDVS